MKNALIFTSGMVAGPVVLVAGIVYVKPVRIKASQAIGRGCTFLLRNSKDFRKAVLKASHLVIDTYEGEK